MADRISAIRLHRIESRADLLGMERTRGRPGLLQHAARVKRGETETEAKTGPALYCMVIHRCETYHIQYCTLYRYLSIIDITRMKHFLSATMSA